MTHLQKYQEFTCLGSVLTPDSDLTSEVQERIKLTSAACGRLPHRVFLSLNLAVATKVAVYKNKAIRLSIMLYGCELWA